jgi:hypothetical protein
MPSQRQVARPRGTKRRGATRPTRSAAVEHRGGRPSTVPGTVDGREPLGRLGSGGLAERRRAAPARCRGPELDRRDVDRRLGPSAPRGTCRGSRPTSISGRSSAAERPGGDLHPARGDRADDRRALKGGRHKEGRPAPHDGRHADARRTGARATHRQAGADAGARSAGARSAPAPDRRGRRARRRARARGRHGRRACPRRLAARPGRSAQRTASRADDRQRRRARTVELVA